MKWHRNQTRYVLQNRPQMRPCQSGREQLGAMAIKALESLDNFIGGSV
jgi:hypothetical protein